MRPGVSYYYNAPDGQKPIEKLVATTKWGALFGTLFGVSEYCLFGYKKTPMQGLNCVANYVIPLTAICATYTTVTYAATKIRDKDGPGNHALGAIASAYILYKWQKRPINALNWGILAVLIAASLKHAKQINYEVIPDVGARTYNDGLFANHDFTWTKDPRPWKQ